MRTTPRTPRVEWRTVAVDNPDATQFAHEYESALQELTDNGFDVVSQMPRGSAMIITARKMSMPEVSSTADTIPPETAPSAAETLRRRMRIVEAPQAKSVSTHTTDEVLYHYIENGIQKQVCLPGMGAALRVVKLHLEEEGYLPISLVCVTMTTFEPSAFPYLLTTFSEEIREDKPVS